MKRAVLALALVMLAPLCARAESRTWVFTPASPPDELIETASAVADEDVTIRLTFAGDCTLGDEAKAAGGRNSFSTKIKKEGMAYPFSLLLPLFAADDFTVVNLEGVLTESGEDKVKKKYNFRGSPAYTEALTLGSVECVSLANNHIRDYGARGEADTKQALNEAGISLFDEGTLCVFEKDGVRIGFTATSFTLSANKELRLAADIELLGRLGCAAIVHVMHAGTEYADTAGYDQRHIARRAVANGATIVVGHHPHVPQNISVIDGVPVVYSLGNCCFGGNTAPKRREALLMSAELHFVSGGLQRLDWTLHPIYISGGSYGNDYRPYPMDDEAAAGLITRLDGLSDIPLAPYIPGVGAKQTTIVYQGYEEREE